MPLRRNGDGVAPERGWRCAGTAIPLRRNGRAPYLSQLSRSPASLLLLTVPCRKWGGGGRLVSAKKGVGTRQQICYTIAVMETKAKDERRRGACGGYRAPRRPLGRARARSEASVCVQVPPPPIRWERCSELLRGVFGPQGLRPLPLGWDGPQGLRPLPMGWDGPQGLRPLPMGWDGSQGLRPLPIFGAVSDGTAADCFSLLSSSQPRSLAGTPGVFVRETQVNPQKQQKGNKKK